MTAKNKDGIESPTIFDSPNTKLTLDLANIIRPTMTLKEVAEMLNTAEVTIVYYSMRKKELPYAIIGQKGDLVFLRTDVLDFLERKKVRGIVSRGNN